jgi:hypothetical protein
MEKIFLSKGKLMILQQLFAKFLKNKKEVLEN